MTERDIFAAALEITDPHMRAEYVQTACGGDLALRLNVEALLRFHDEAGSFLEDSPLLPADTIANVPPTCPGAATPAAPMDTFITQAVSEFEALSLLTPSPRPGLLGTIDHYEIHAVLGRGAMGIVYKAHDPRLNRVVAVKVLAPEFAANLTARRRFLREAQAAAAVSHPHVVTIHAVDEGLAAPQSSSQVSPRGMRLPYLVMEYIAGQTLRDKLDHEGPLPLGALLRIGAQIASGLAAAHQQGLIHRDVKPANVLLENGVERVKLTDFGLARAVDDVGMTQTGEVAGTPQFMSPEQAQGAAIDHRSDLFSLGSVLYTMCTARPPFQGDTVVSVLRRVCDEQPRPIRELNPEIPPWLVAIVERLMAKNPADRFQSAQEVADLLSDHLARLHLPAGPSRPLATVAAPAPSRPPRRWLTAAAVCAVAAFTLGTTEATGVTNFTGAIIRVVRGDGTLVIAVDDPEVSVTIEGEDLVITGAGAKEIRVPAGSHRVTFSKDGRPIDQKLVTVTRGGREIVTATFQPAAPPVRLSQAELDEMSRRLRQQFPAAGLGLMFNERELTITGAPRDQAEADAILHELRRELAQRFDNLGPREASGSATVDEGTLPLIDLLHISGASSVSGSAPAAPLTREQLEVGLRRHARLLTTEGLRVHWSADGQELVYTRNDGTAIETVQVLTGERRVRFRPEGWEGKARIVDAVMSPNSQRIAFARRPWSGDRDVEQIWVVDADGQNPRHVADGSYPSWDPNSERLFFASRHPGQLLSVDLSQPDSLPTRHGAVDGFYPVVSPNGELTACGVAMQLQLTRTANGDPVAQWQAPRPIYGMILNWSADSRHLSIAGYTEKFVELWIYDVAEGTAEEFRCEGIRSASWSPDGTWLALETDIGNGTVWIVPIGRLQRTLETLRLLCNPAVKILPQTELTQDLELVVRAGRGRLTDPERSQLLAVQHPLAGQWTDPQTKPILEAFARLPDRSHQELLRTGWLKWRYAELPPEFQRVYHDALAVNVESAQKSGVKLPPTFSLATLEQAEVGFALIDIPDKQACVVSWFILLPEHPAPIWVTVVNARHAGTPEYFAAHNAQLNALRLKPLSTLPAAVEEGTPSPPREPSTSPGDDPNER